jgi:hypothetical protein
MATNGNKRIKLDPTMMGDEIDEETLNSGAEG